MAPEEQVTPERDEVYIINKYDNLTTYNWRGKKYVFPYNVPVKVDFTNDPDLVSTLLQCPQLQICTRKESRLYLERIAAKKATKKTEVSEVVNPDSETEKLLNDAPTEDSNDKAPK